MKKETRLYNILFPIWMLMIIPTAWVAILPINFIVDSLVLILTAKKMKILTAKFYKRYILKVWIFGFIADFIGALYMLGMMWIFEIDTQPDDFRLTIPAMLISAVMIFILNFFSSFKDLDKRERIKMAFSFAIFTAPYTFLIPLSWIYG